MSTDEFKFVTPGMFDYLDKKRDALEARREEADVRSRYEHIVSVDWPRHDCALDGVPVSLFDHAVKNHRQASTLLFSRAKLPALDLESLKEIHACMMAGLSREAGKFRSAETAPLTGDHDPPDSRAVESGVRHLLEWTSADSFGELHAIQQAALVLIRLLDLAPFTDGNSRTCRCIANIFLNRAQFPPAVVRLQEETAYREAVEAGLKMDTTALTTVLANAVARNLDFCLHGSKVEPQSA